MINRSNGSYHGLQRLLEALSEEEAKPIWDQLCRAGTLPDALKPIYCSKTEVTEGGMQIDLIIFGYYFRPS